MSESTNPNENPTFSSPGEKAEESKTPSAPIPVPEIKRYKVLKQIAEGGMGVVYLAEQQHPIKRKVAIKAIKKGMDSKNVLKRFELERQTLALLNHPCIAQIFDAGITKEGRSYFVMEYVEGEPITDFCDKYKLSIENRLKLFLQVCDAIQYAHQKGIIHRDIKPSNILVAKDGNKVQLKVIDFGIAKAVKHGGGEQSLITQQGQLVGTPAYMSPEQAGKTEEDVDTRTDIYSLGVLLYELLTGTQPFDRERLQKAALFEILKVIQEEEPPRPSTRLSSLGDTAIEMAQKRRTEVISLARLLHNELEWIPIRAMRKDRDQRYQTASEVASDIKNYLKGNPLLAGPESNTYKIKKFVRRNKTAVIGSLATLIILIAAIFITTYLTIHVSGLNTQLVNTSDELAETNEELKSTNENLKNEKEKAETKAEALRQSEYCNTMGLGYASLRENNIKHVYELLKKCPKDLLNWEWYHLFNLANQAKMTLFGPRKPVHSVACSPDGKYYAAGGVDGLLYIWDASTGEKLQVISKHYEIINSVTFSPDSKYIATAGNDGRILIWNILEKKITKYLIGHQHRVNSIAYFSDGSKIVSGSDDNTVKIWDIQNNYKLYKTLYGHNKRVTTVAIDSNNNWIASAGRDPNLIIWNAKNYQQERTIKLPHGAVRDIFFSPDSKKIFYDNGGINAVVISNKENPREVIPNSFGVISFALSHNGKYIAAGGTTGPKNYFTLWDLDTNKAISTFRGHEEDIISMSFSYDDKYIISGGKNHVKVWDVSFLEDNKTHKNDFPEWAVYQSIHPDGTHIAVVGSNEKFIRIYNSLSGSEITKLYGQGGSITFVAHSPDGKYIASAWTDNLIIIWDAISFKKLQVLKGHNHKVNAVTFSSDSEYIASGSEDGEVILWDKSVGFKPKPFNIRKASIRILYFTPDNNRIVYLTSGGQVKILDIDTGLEIRSYTLKGVSYFVISPNGKYFADSLFRIWELDTCKFINIFGAHIQSSGSVAFSSNGKRLITTNLIDQKVKIWDFESGNEIVSFSFPHYLWGADMSPDGRFISCYGNNMVKIWRASTDEEVRNHMPEYYTQEESRQLIACYKFEQNKNNQVLDNSGNELHGMLKGDAQIISDSERGNVLSLDGDGDYVDCGFNELFQITEEITLSVWIKINKFDKKPQMILANGDDTWRLSSEANTDSLQFRCTALCVPEAVDLDHAVSTKSKVDDNKWHHIICVYDKKKIAIYVDGKLENSLSAIGKIHTTGCKFFIGENSRWPNLEWNGLIDDVIIYNYALTAEQVNELYDNSK